MKNMKNAARKMQMRRCRKCDCICDPSDLINGICDDCRESARKEKENKQKMNRLAMAEFKQIRLEELTSG